MYDTVKAELRFGMYRYANTEMELNLAGLINEGYENELERQLILSRRMVCIAEAMLLRAIAELAAARPGKTPDQPYHEWAADELSLMMNWTHNTAHHKLQLAQAVTTRLPGTLAALGRGTDRTACGAGHRRDHRPAG